MRPAALPFSWDGEAMRPLRGFQRRCDATFVVGEVYRLEPVEERSAASHRHYFAALTEAWQNLPEAEAERFATSDHLRRWCLIRAGFHDSRQIVASSKAEAARLAGFIKPMDEYAVVAVKGVVVTVYTAKSQSVRAMGKAEFQASKDKVLEVAAGLIGVAPEALAARGREAA